VLLGITDPTFDPGGGKYRPGSATLRTLMGLAPSPHHHSENLDCADSVLGIVVNTCSPRAGPGPAIQIDLQVPLWQSS
jgi:hypothetical protein